jgi:hypothetical protein
MNKRKVDESIDLRIQSAKRALYYRYECPFHCLDGSYIVKVHDIDGIPLEDIIGCYEHKCKSEPPEMECLYEATLCNDYGFESGQALHNMYCKPCQIYTGRWWHATERRMGKLRRLCFDPVSQLDSKIPVPRDCLMRILSFL